MKKRSIYIGLCLFSIFLFTINCGLAAAFKDTDDDGIDDDFENLNKRDIDYVIEGSEISIESVRKVDKKKDLILTTIDYNVDGLQFQIGYKPNLESDFELLFGITFRELVEYIDVDFDGIYNPEVDQNIQNFSLNEFSPLFYENSTCPSGSVMHHFLIQTENETFTAHIYFAEEFTFVEETLILPTQARIDIEISNFTYLDSNSQLALHTRLESDSNYEKQEDTEDENNGYAENEEGVKTIIDTNVGFFTWKGDAKFDNVSKSILSSGISPDDHIENAEKLFINYRNGTQIYHSSKIGIEGLLIYVQSPSLIPLFIFVVIIGALSVVATYSIFHARKQENVSKIHKRPGEDDYREILEAEEIDYLFDSKLALQILEEKGAIENLYHKGDINLTTISSDFYELIKKFGLEELERRDFIREMLSLTPKERELFLREMINDSQ